MNARRNALKGIMVLAVSAATLLGGALPAHAGHDGFCDYAFEDGDICLYQDANYKAGMLDFTRSDKNYTSAADVFYYDTSPSGTNINDQASSLVNGEYYCTWYMYTDANFGGYGFIVHTTMPAISNIGIYFGSAAYNDSLSSHYKWTGSTECINGSTS